MRLLWIRRFGCYVIFVWEENMDGEAQPNVQPTVEVPLETPVDPYGRKPALQLNLQPLKEPRGFVRVLQFVFSIFAFSTTAGFWTDVKYVGGNPATCPNVNFEVMFDYPFELDRVAVSSCYGPISLVGDFSAQAEYFVASGVLTFLYCIAITIIYVLYDQLYQNNALLPVIDFVATAIFTIFWLTASSAWAQGVNDLKYYSDPNHFLMLEDSCDSSICYSTYSGSFATLNVSLIFGFLNFALWGASLWFVFKETEWFKRRQTPAG